MNNRNRQITHEYQVEYDEQKYIIVRCRRIKQHSIRNHIENGLLTIGITCLLSTAFLGIGALGCWGVEIIGANSSSNIINWYNWQARKNICFGGMVVCISGVFGSALLNGCLNFDK